MWHSLPIEEVLRRLNTSLNGLTDEEVKNRLKIYGKNEIKLKEESLIFKIIEIIKNPFLLLFIFADIISFIFQGFIDGIAIFMFLLLYIIFDLINERRYSKIIKSLMKSIEKDVMVVRNGTITHVKASEIVPGDIIILRYGEFVPADIRIIEEKDLEVDESALTGESDPVRKKVDIVSTNAPVKDRINMLFFGTHIVRGYCKGVVVATGNNTYYGSIYKNLEKEKREKTLLQIELEKFSVYMTVIVVIIMIISAIYIYIFNILPLNQLLIFVVAIGVLVIPEGLPAALTLIYALSVDKLRRENIFVKNPNILEDLGNVDTVILDKTGTLSYNYIDLKGFYFNGKIYKVKYEDNKIKILKKDKEVDLNGLQVFLTFLYNSIDDYSYDIYENGFGNPINLAIYRVGKQLNLKFLERIDVNYFDSYRKRSSVIVNYEGKKYSIVKGSVDSIIKISKYIYLDNEIKEINKNIDKIKNITEKYSKKGFKILALGIKILDNDNDVEKDVIFYGIILLKEKIRKGVKNYIDFLKFLNLNIYIVTGDNRENTENLLKILKLNFKVKDAREIKKLNDEELYKLLKNYNAIVNADPEDKYRIVKVLKKKGHRVLFVGDGINDSIAMKISNVGVSFYNAADITKDSANVLLLDEGIEAIVELIKEGKRIIYSLKTYIVTVLSAIIGIFLFMVIGFFVYKQIFLESLQLLLLNLVAETIFSITINVSEVKDEKMYKQLDNRLFDKNIIYNFIRNAIFIGLNSVIVALATFNNVYTIMLFLIVSQAILLMYYEKKFNLSITSSKQYYISIFLSVMIISIFLLPYLRDLIGFVIPAMIDISVFVIVALYMYAIFEILYRVEKSAVSEHLH
ncbi:MAG: cation-translocating P-type ATPase [Nanopusillaceae archaeon]